MKKWGPSVLIFLAGLLLGMSFGWWGRAHHSPGRRLEHFSKKLDLTSEQSAKVKTLMDEKRKSTKEEIRKILNPEQLKKYEQMEARREKRRKKRHGPPPPHP